MNATISPAYYPRRIQTTYDRLVEVLGEPDPALATDKTRAEWRVETPYGEVHVYDYQQRAQVKRVREWTLNSYGNVAAENHVHRMIHPSLPEEEETAVPGLDVPPPSAANDYCSVHYVTDAAYRCDRELIPGRPCLAPAEFGVGLMDGESHALYADVLSYTCGQHLPQMIRDLLFETNPIPEWHPGSVAFERAEAWPHTEASELSCQALASYCEVMPDGTVLFHGSVVFGYDDEIERRGRGHVDSCNLIGHTAD
jgi:hypothetical protein